MIFKGKILISLLIVFTILCGGAFAQDMSGGEQEVKNMANELFISEKYIEALPLYSQLLSIYPREAIYNYRYGACLVEVNKELDKAIKYLEYSLTRVEDPMVYYFLGKAYHRTYVFDYAINFYGFFIKYGKKSDFEKYQVKRLIKMCNNGRDLVRYIGDLIVLDNKKIKNENIYYSYELDDFGGRIIVKPAEYKSGIDKKKEENSLMFISTVLDVNYYSSCINKKAGRDIFRLKKLPDGSWSKPENLGPVINTIYDEDYPYIHPNGKTLYFCSKGHNSMGGYDIFRSEYDSVKMAWSAPENLDFPTNSPYDDILFISDANEDYAYFASNRETGKDRISVYKIQIDKSPVERVYDNIEEIIKKSRLEITPESEIIALRDNVINTDIIRENTDVEARRFNFAEVELADNVTPDFIVREAGRDAEIMEQQVMDLKKESNIALIVAEEKNSLSDEKYDEAESILSDMDNISDPDEQEYKRREAEQLKDEAYELDKEAIAAYNLANTLNNAVQEKQKEAQETKDLAERIAANTGNKDVETLVGDLNSMRRLLNMSQEKYVSPQSEIANRQASFDVKNNKIQELINNETALNNELSEIETTINETNNKINGETDNNAKTELQDQLNSLLSGKQNIEAKKQNIVSEVKSLKAETDNLNDEIKFLASLDNKIRNNTESYEFLSARTGNIDNEMLSKEIYDKELRIDEIIAGETAVSISDNVTITDRVTSDEIAGDSETSSESQELKEEYVHLYAEANEIENEIISLKELADSKRNRLENITDQNERTEISEQIRGQEERVVELQDDLQKKLSSAHEKELKYLAFSSIRKSSKDAVKDNPAVNFEFDDTELSEEENEYQRETFAEKSYQHISNALQERIRFMETSMDYITDEKTRKAVQEEIDLLKEIAEDNQSRTDISNDKLQEILAGSPDKIENKNIRPDALLVKATNYKPENTLVTDPRKYAEVRDIENERRYADQMYKDWERNNNEIKVYENQRDKIKDEKAGKNLDKKIKGLMEEAKVHFHNFNVIYENSNTELYEMYDELMEDNRMVANHDDVKLANSLEQEAKVYYENAAVIRMNASIIDEYVEMSDVLIKAKNLEMVALNKQKHALDLYIKAEIAGVQDDPEYAEALKNPGTTDDNAEAFTEDRILADAEGTVRIVVPGEKSIGKEVEFKKIYHDEITLLLEEEDQLDTARQHKYFAETLQKKAEKNLETVAEKRKLAEQIYSKGKKKKILKGMDELEEQGKNDLVMALLFHIKSDSIKYHLYDKQIDVLSKELEEIADNTTISRQYKDQATHFFNEAQNLRRQAENEINIDDKIKTLKKAAELEKDAIRSQNVAVEVLVDVDPVLFVANSDIVTMDRLERLNKPVDVRDVKTIQEFRVIEQVEFEKMDLKDIDNANTLITKAENILEEAEIVSNQAENLRQKAEAETSKGKKKKMMKEVGNLETKALKMKIEAGDNYDFAHENKYFVFKDGLNKVRIDDNSQKARKGRQLEKDADKNFRKANALREQAFYSEDLNKSERLLKTAYDLEVLALEQQQKAYNVYLSMPEIMEDVGADSILASNVTDENVIRKEEADVTPLSETKDLYEDDGTFVVDNTTEDRSEVATDEITDNIRTEETDLNDITVSDTESVTETDTGTDTGSSTTTTTEPESLTTISTNSIYSFSLSSSSYYSGANPISVNPELPSGIVFKVQVGAFLNPIPQNTFNPLQPVTAEKLPNSRFKRFLVGLFRSLEVTRLILDDVRSRGYEDAFIVAYKDGVRITLYQAGNQIRSSPGDVLDRYNMIAQNEVDMYRNQRSATTSTVAESSTTATVAEASTTASRDYVKSKDIDDVSGLLYTVQIGVYRNPVTSDELFNINPIYESRSETGFIRYSTGIFNNYDLAVSEKNRIADVGVLDAFVTAYYNGMSISIRDAGDIYRSEGSGIYAGSSSVNVPDRSPDTPGTVSPGSVSGNIMFTVQIGAYKEQVPTEIVNSFLRVSADKGLDQFTNEIGYTLYLVGKYDNYKDASDMKVILMNEGIPDAFVVAFRGDKKITVEEARNLQGQ